MLKKKRICICIHVHKKHESEYSNEIFKILSTLKNKESEIKIELVEKIIIMDEDFEKN